ncbi:Zn-dependent hydrolase [Thermanaeromonas sp. C210]|uniref:Zn-dependent hydrolase n=1 Tax=Thermanaeromonas sp. C210 TaxID=2731925 RepID=UPI00155C896D|nr:Zn-dependent hydrolase [Thermanaeromonas sp. C210]GFN23405.1 Zn-dependent hydrolase [Thermanaeromonas sp. C210]
MSLKINGKRLKERLIALSEFGKDEAGGWSRFTWTDDYIRAKELVKQWMREAGMTVREDAMGNVFGRLAGLDDSLPVVAAGSHIDSVKCGGMFDGNVGVLGALEVITTIAENKIKTKHPLEVIIFVEEDGARFNWRILGARAMVGEVARESLDKYKDKDGISIAQAMEAAGYDPNKISEVKIDPKYYKCFFEMHIEQSHCLESEGVSVGVVEGIFGSVWLKVTLKGRADHAGATPMKFRKDALVAASEIIIAMEKIAKEAGETTVGTVGWISVQPCMINTIPGIVEMTLDIRDINEKNLETAINNIRQFIGEVCKKRNIEVEIEEVVRFSPIHFPDHMIDTVEQAAKEEGIPFMRIASGAGHDAQALAKLIDVGMIFTPSRGGLSHCPDEYTDYEDIAKCAQVLLKAMLKKAEVVA